jgi:hypothetical protein
MEEIPQQVRRGPQLLAAHLRSFDPTVATARERVEEALGPELAHTLVCALAPGRHCRRAS